VADDAPGPPGIEQANALAEAQLTMQATFITNLDARAVGYLGLSLALGALDISLRDDIGGLWWLPVAGFVVAALLSILALTPLRFQLGPHLPDLDSEGRCSRPLPLTTRSAPRSQETPTIFLTTRR
jgi:hypothetical protein